MMTGAANIPVLKLQTRQLEVERAIAKKFHERFLVALESVHRIVEYGWEPIRWKAPSTDNLIRLLTLRGLQLRHRLPLTELLLVVYRSVPSSQYQRINIARLCGPLAVKSINAYVSQQYPQGQNLSAWNSDQQLRQILNNSARSAKLGGFPEGTMVADYRRYLQQVRKRIGDKGTGVGSKPYRGNPWLKLGK